MSSNLHRDPVRRVLACLLAVAGGLAVTLGAQTVERSAPGVTGATVFYPDDPLWRDDDMRSIPPPAVHDLSKSHDFVVNTFGDARHPVGPALNVNTLGEVPDSSWFTNRIGIHQVTLEDLLRGPNQVDGPAPGPWQVMGRPDAGITPKFTIRDTRGDVYLIKLDPASNPELPSSVELISTKIFHAIGYHVPEDYLVDFDRSRLRAGPGALKRLPTGARVPLEESDIDRWLRRAPRQSSGTIRAIASRYVPGRVVGQFQYAGRRSDDANDIYPHERRRELRGMRLIAAWLNHDDARSLNSIDTYVEEQGRRYIRHYLQDFGSNLGSGSTSAQQPRGGYEYLIEGDKIWKGLALFGWYQRDWTRARFPNDPSVGNIEAEVFDPATWKTEYPHPAFAQMDAADAFWATNLISRFTNEMVRHLVAEARLSRPEAAATLTDIIIRRRDKVVRHGLSLANPIDRFEVRDAVVPELTFDNAAIRLDTPASRSRYRIRWSAWDNTTARASAIGIPMTHDEPRVAVPDGAWGPRDAANARYAVASIATLNSAFPSWAAEVHVTIRDRTGARDIVGVDRLGRVTSTPPDRAAASRLDR